MRVETGTSEDGIEDPRVCLGWDETSSRNLGLVKYKEPHGWEEAGGREAHPSPAVALLLFLGQHLSLHLQIASQGLHTHSTGKVMTTFSSSRNVCKFVKTSLPR